MAASVRGGTYSHVAVVGGASGGERGAASTTAAAAARQRRAMPTGGAVTPPHGAPAHGERGGRHGARAGGCTALGRTVATMEFYIFARNSLSGPLCEIIFFVHRRFAVKCERGSCLLLQRSRATLPTDRDAEIISDPSIHLHSDALHADGRCAPRARPGMLQANRACGARATLLVLCRAPSKTTACFGSSAPGGRYRAQVSVGCLWCGRRDKGGGRVGVSNMDVAKGGGVARHVLKLRRGGDDNLQ